MVLQGLVLGVGLAVAAEVPPGKFQNPINPGPDPYMVVHEGNYY